VTEHCAAGLRGSTCAVCDQDDAVNTTLVPCGHACVCQPCALALRAAKRDTCPLCAAKILYVTPLYVSGGDGAAGVLEGGARATSSLDRRT